MQWMEFYEKKKPKINQKQKRRKRENWELK